MIILKSKLKKKFFLFGVFEQLSFSLFSLSSLEVYQRRWAKTLFLWSASQGRVIIRRRLRSLTGELDRRLITTGISRKNN
jgi:hypothetical protein